MEIVSVLQTSGVVVLTVGLLEVLKQGNLVPSKIVPLVALVLGVLVCLLAVAAGLLPAKNIATIVWEGLLAGLLSCGLYSTVKNVGQHYS